MRVTLDFVKKRFDDFNSRYFNSELPAIPIRITNARSYVGKVVYERNRKFLRGEKAVNFRMLFSRCLDLDEKVLEDTVLHEMIHYWILFKGIKDTSAHGQVFRKMMHTFNRLHGHNVTVTHRISESEKQTSLTAARGVVVCVSAMTDGRLAVTVAMKSKLGYLWAELPKWEKLTVCRWYYVAHPFFSFFPKSKTVKVYPVERSKLIEAMATARELVRDGDRLIISRTPFDITHFE